MGIAYDWLSKVLVPLVGIVLLAACAYPMTSAVESTVQPSSTPAPATSLGQASIHVERGRAFLAQGLPEPAIAEFNQAIALNPENVEAYASRGFARIKLGQFEQGIADYDQAIKLAPDHPMLYNDRGFAYAEHGLFERAILDYTQAIELDPHHSHIDYAYNNRGFAYGNLEKYEQAFRDFDRAVELNPGNAWIYFNRALIHVQRGETIPAIRDLERSLELDNPSLNHERRSKAEELLEQLQNWGSEA